MGSGYAFGSIGVVCGMSEGLTNPLVVCIRRPGQGAPTDNLARRLLLLVSFDNRRNIRGSHPSTTGGTFAAAPFVNPIKIMFDISL